MARAECANGHIYDTDQYATCPYCNPRSSNIEFRMNGGSGPTVMPGMQGGAAAGRTVAPGLGNMAPDTPVHNPEEGGGRTVAPEEFRKQQENANKTVAEFQKKYEKLPVAGWLVCTEGKAQGEAFTLRAKINFIGRDAKMDVSINDPTVTRENHARIAYDPRHNVFLLINGESGNNIYLNDEPIYVPTKLAAYDLVEIGSHKFRFVPFCSDRFQWESVLG